ncbi:MAG: hypothetical protein WCE21_03305 [Candidatus Babeliales bacterium]
MKNISIKTILLFATLTTGISSLNAAPSFLMRALHWGIVFYLPVTTTTQIFAVHNEVNDMFKDASPLVTAFVQEEFAKVNSNTPRKIMVKSTSGIETLAANSLHNHILISKSLCKELEAILQKKNISTLGYSDTLALNEARASLRHEFNHINHNDSQAKLALNLAIPIATALSLKTMHAGFLRAFGWQNKIPTCISNAWQIPSGLGKLGLNTYLGSQASIRREQRADDEIENNVYILQGAKRNFERFAAQEKAFHEKYDGKIAELPQSIQQSISLYESLKMNHPSTQHRLDQFNKRIATLQKNK